MNGMKTFLGGEKAGFAREVFCQKKYPVHHGKSYHHVEYLVDRGQRATLLCMGRRSRMAGTFSLPQAPLDRFLRAECIDKSLCFKYEALIR
jgi:hypothetical protein